MSFADARAAAGFMEPPEVMEDAYLVFDRTGHEAVLGVERFDVVITAWSAEPAPDRLRGFLTRYLEEHEGFVDQDASLDDLAARADRTAVERDLARTRPRVLIPILRWFRARRASAS